MSLPLMTIAEWQAYRAGNLRANREYAARTSIAPLIIDSIDVEGVTVTAQRYQMTREELVDWFPDVIYPRAAVEVVA